MNVFTITITKMLEHDKWSNHSGFPNLPDNEQVIKEGSLLLLKAFDVITKCFLASICRYKLGCFQEETLRAMLLFLTRGVISNGRHVCMMVSLSLHFSTHLG